MMSLRKRSLARKRLNSRRRHQRQEPDGLIEIPCGTACCLVAEGARWRDSDWEGHLIRQHVHARESNAARGRLSAPSVAHSGGRSGDGSPTRSLTTEKRSPLLKSGTDRSTLRARRRGAPCTPYRRAASEVRGRPDGSRVPRGATTRTCPTLLRGQSH